ncbi:hypothetical protein FQN57_004029 [Myotisia sp. PD_48]|nr:hypothetical protein FQN57_004029 [Myotisia sp. PD_48]
MSYAVTAKKRKFHRILDSIAHSTPQKAAPAPPAAQGDDNNKPRSVEPLLYPTIKRVRLSEGIPSDDAEPSTPSRRISKHPTSSTTSLRPNFVPWDRERFLERLETFRSVERWKPQPEDIDEVQWAKRGWSCTDVMRVDCVGGCGHSLVVRLPDDDEDLEDYDSEKVADRKEVRSQLIEKYQKLIIEGHGEKCPWRRSGCDDSIQRLPLSKVEAALHDLRTRYLSLSTLHEKLPLIENLIIPEEFDGDLLQKILLPSGSFVADGAHNDTPNVTEPPTNVALEGAQGLSSDTSDGETNKVAFAMAFFGWDLSGNASAGLAGCKACFRRLGLWMFKAKADGTSSLYSGLDVVSEHMDYCPWINAATQSGRKKTGRPGWEILGHIIETELRRTTPLAGDLALSTDREGSVELASEEASEEKKKIKDKEWWAKLRRVRQALRPRTPKQPKDT